MPLQVMHVGGLEIHIQVSSEFDEAVRSAQDMRAAYKELCEIAQKAVDEGGEALADLARYLNPPPYPEEW